MSLAFPEQACSSPEHRAPLRRLHDHHSFPALRADLPSRMEEPEPVRTAARPAAAPIRPQRDSCRDGSTLLTSALDGKRQVDERTVEPPVKVTVREAAG